RSHVTACAAKNTHPDTSKALHTGTAELARKTGFALACAAARALITSRVLQGLFHQRLRLGDAATFLFGQCALLRGARRDRDELVVVAPLAPEELAEEAALLLEDEDAVLERLGVLGEGLHELRLIIDPRERAVEGLTLRNREVPPHARGLGVRDADEER